MEANYQIQSSMNSNVMLSQQSLQSNKIQIKISQAQRKLRFSKTMHAFPKFQQDQIQSTAQKDKQASEDESLNIMMANIQQYYEKNLNMFHKYDQAFFIQCISEKKDKINFLQQYSGGIHNPMDIAKFVYMILSEIKHKKDQNLPLMFGAIQFFWKVKRNTEKFVSNEDYKFADMTQTATSISISELTDYICDKVNERDPQLIVPYRITPSQKSSIQNDTLALMKQAQTILNLDQFEQEIQIVGQDMLTHKSLKRLHQNKNIKQYSYFTNFFSKKKTGNLLLLDTIAILGQMGQKIVFYGSNLNYIGQIQPNSENQQGQRQKYSTIVSFAVASKFNEICAIVKHFGLIVWALQIVDKSKPIYPPSTNKKQKEFEIKSSIKVLIKCNPGNKIFFFQEQENWVTIDRNIIYFWGIKSQNCKLNLNLLYKLDLADIVSINDISQIVHLKAICISANCKNNKKWLYIYRKTQFLSKFQLDTQTSCHTIHYNQFTNTLLPLCYSPTVNVYSLNPFTYDFTLKAKLKGHNTIVTCIDSIGNSRRVITGDDKGWVRIWQLNYMKCLQIVRLTSFLTKIKVAAIHGREEKKNFQLVYVDQRLNILPLQKYHFCSEKTINTSNINTITFPTPLFHMQHNKFTYIITSKDCRVLNQQTGRIDTIYIIAAHNSSEEIISCIKVQDHDCFLVGTSKGLLYCYCFKGKKIWTIYCQSQVLKIWLDEACSKSKNKQIIILTAQREIKIYEFPAFTFSTQSLDYQNIKPSRILNLGIENIMSENSNQIKFFKNKNNTRQLIKKQQKKQNQVDKVTICCLSSKYRLFATISEGKNVVTIWDYEIFKIYQSFAVSPTQSAISCLKMSEEAPILGIGFYNGLMQLYKFQKQGHNLQLLLAYSTTLNQSQVINKIQSSQKIQNSHLTIHNIKSNATTANNTNTEKVAFEQSQAQMVEGFQFILGAQKKQNSIVIWHGSGWITNFYLDAFNIFLGKVDLSNTNKSFSKNQLHFPQRQKRSHQNLNKSKNGRKFCLNYTIRISKHYSDTVSEQSHSQVSNIQQLQLQSCRKVHKQTIYSLSLSQHKQLLLHSISIDGYYKITTLKSLQTLCSMNLKYPLPIIWKPLKPMMTNIRIRMLQVLQILQIIQRNYQLQFTQKSRFDIKDFLQVMEKKDVKISSQGAHLVQKYSLSSSKIFQKPRQPSILINGNQRVNLKQSIENDKAQQSLKDSSQKLMLLRDFYTPQDLRKDKQLFNRQKLKSHSTFKYMKPITVSLDKKHSRSIVSKQKTYNQVDQYTKIRKQQYKKASHKQVLQYLRPAFLPNLQKKLNIKEVSIEKIKKSKSNILSQKLISQIAKLSVGGEQSTQKKIDSSNSIIKNQSKHSTNIQWFQMNEKHCSALRQKQNEFFNTKQLLKNVNKKLRQYKKSAVKRYID